VGLVVGATAPAELERIRGIAPALAFLVPGIGAQGGDLEAVLRHGPAAPERPGGGLLVNVSRGISGAAAHAGDVGEQLSAAARDWAERLALTRLATSRPEAEERR
jgi:orotidine-5'-phosphate decarboxylase